MNNIYFKWAFFIVLTPLQFYVAMFLGVLTLGFIDELCATELNQIEAENPFTCAEQPSMSTLVITVFTSLAAIRVVLVGTITCPIKSERVPFIIYSLGAIVALIMVASFAVSLGEPKYLNEIYIEVFCALFLGYITSVIMSKRTKNKM